MNYIEFKDTLVSAIKEQLDASYSVSLHKVIKNNGLSLDSVLIKSSDNNISPTLYINHLYGTYENGESINNIAKNLIELYEKFKIDNDFDTSVFDDFEKAKDNIFVKLVNYERNKKLLSDVPYIEFLDLAIVFYYRVDTEYIPDGSILVNNTILHHWNISKDCLYQFAQKNTNNIYKIKISKVYDLIYEKLSDEEKEVFDFSEDFPLYVLTNDQNFYGASCLLDNTTLTLLSKMHDSSLYIIPSSIHETLFIPEKDNPIDLDYMTAMVKSVNTYDLSAHEYLSDHVYYFNREDNSLSIAG